MHFSKIFGLSALVTSLLLSSAISFAASPNIYVAVLKSEALMQELAALQGIGHTTVDKLETTAVYRCPECFDIEVVFSTVNRDVRKKTVSVFRTQGNSNGNIVVSIKPKE